MQFRTLLVSLLTAATATAQTTTSPPPAVSTNLVTLVQQLPPCGLSCLSKGAAAINCNPANFSCLCSNSASLVSNIGACVLLACSSDDAGKLSSLTPQICAVVNANANPTQVSSASVIVASAVGSASSSKSSNIARATDAPALSVMGGAAVVFAALAL